MLPVEAPSWECSRRFFVVSQLPLLLLQYTSGAVSDSASRQIGEGHLADGTLGAFWGQWFRATELDTTSFSDDGKIEKDGEEEELCVVFT